MCSERLSQYRELINCMPADEQTTVADIDRWAEKLEKTRCNDLPTILGPHCWCKDKGTIEISRRDLFELARKEQRISKRLILAVFIWGYPTGGRGHNCRRMIEKIETIEDVFASVSVSRAIDQNGVNELFTQLQGCGIGLSTLTKLLYFGEFKVGGYDALILDSKVIKAFERGLFTEFSELNANGTVRYEAYLRVMSEVARELRVTNLAKLEMFLFLFSNSLKSPCC